MKNLSLNFKLAIAQLLGFFSFVASFYLSIIFFTYLIIDEEFKGNPNPELKDEFVAFTSKISSLPEKLFTAPKNKEGVDLSGETF